MNTPQSDSAPAPLGDDTMPAPEDPKAPAQWTSLYLSLLEKHRAALDALDPKLLVMPNVDIPSAIITARGAVPALRILRPRVLLLGPEVKLALYDSVLDFARLLHYAHSSYLATLALPDALPQLNADGIKMRDYLLGAATAAVTKGLLAKELLAQVRSGSGYQDTSTHLLELTSALRAIWPAMNGRTLIDATELDEADALAEKISDAVAMRTGHAARVARRVSDRQLAFTLFSRAYGEARSVTSFLLRDEGTADKLVPSLYAGRGGSRRKQVVPPAGDKRAPVGVPKPGEPASPTIAAR